MSNPFDRLRDLQVDNDLHAAFMAGEAPRFDAYRTRHEDGTAPRVVTAFNLFQTPPELAARMVSLADIRPGSSILEPSAGLGRLLVGIQEWSPGRVVACDSSPDCCREIMQGFPEVLLVQGDFLDPCTQARILDKLDPTGEAPRFDRVLMNPPFKMRADLKHVSAALDLLAPGGVLVGLCLSGYRRREFLESHGAEVWTIEAGTFKKEGTNVETLLFRIQHN